MITKVRDFFHKIFYEAESRFFLITNDFLSFLTLFSVLVIVLESVHSLSAYHGLFLGIEYVAVFFFTIEYLGRIAANPKPLSYIFSFFGFVDLISVLPTYLGLGNLIPLKTVRVVRILRFLRIIRLTKIARMKLEEGRRVLLDPEHYSSIYRLNLEIYLLALITTVLILGSLLYVFEHEHPGFSNIPVSMLWILESILGGSISQFVPESIPGVIIGIIARFAGFVLLGFLIHLIGSTLNRALLGKDSKFSDGKL